MKIHATLHTTDRDSGENQCLLNKNRHILKEYKGSSKQTVYLYYMCMLT